MQVTSKLMKLFKSEAIQIQKKICLKKKDYEKRLTWDRLSMFKTVVCLSQKLSAPFPQNESDPMHGDKSFFLI